MTARDEPACSFPGGFCAVHHGAPSDRCLVVHGMVIVEERAAAAAAMDRERARLETIVIQQQTELSRLEKANDRVHIDNMKRGETNQRLNKQVQELVRVLTIARDRAVGLGNDLVERGGTELNREQFLRLVETAIESARRAGKAEP